jgi:hypothetical protein
MSGNGLWGNKHMNITYSIDKILRIVTLIYTGNPDFDEWATTMRDVFRDPGFRPGFSFILDRRLVTVAPSTDYIKKIANFIKGHPIELGKCFTALVVSEIASYGMGRMSQGFLSDVEHVQVFKDIEEAKQWLRLQSPNEFTHK